MMKFGFFARRDQAERPPLRYHAIARLYEYEGQLIVCSVADIAETDSLTLLTPETDNGTLGETVLRHLAEYRVRDGRDLRLLKLRDWAAFRASGARSVKSFQAGLWQVDLAIMNTAVLIEARPRLSLKPDIGACSTASPGPPDRVGSAVRDAIAAAKILREQGIV